MADLNPVIDANWIRSVVKEYERPLVLYAMKIVGDRERARDVVQETFLKLCRQDKTKLESYIVEWLYTVCRNQALDVCRKEGRMVRLTDGHITWKASDEPAPSDKIEQLEMTRLVLSMVDDLPSKQQEAIRLKFQHGLSYRQINKVMDLTTSYVGYLIHAGLKTIRDKLSDVDEFAAGPVARIPGPTRRPSKSRSRDDKSKLGGAS